METESKKKPRVLCLHAFRSSGEIMKRLVNKWPDTVLQKLDLVFPDGPFPAAGKSYFEGLFDPPYFEWFRSNEDFSEFTKFEECLGFLEDYMLEHGPFDGLMGFSQGAALAAAFPGMQLGGVALKRVPKIKFLIIISGAKFGGKRLGVPKLAADAFSSPVQCPSLHLLGELDSNKEDGAAMLDCFVHPVVINHPTGHTVPELDKKSVETVLSFIDKIQEQ